MDSALQSIATDQQIDGGRINMIRSPDPVLRVNNLTKSFHNESVPVFRNVSFDIHEGQSVALIGANGCGKSTLLRSCLKLIEADSGTITLNGQDIHTLSGRALRSCRSRVGFVFQKHNLVPRLSVLTNVLHGALARGHGMRCWLQSLAPQEEREKALRCLEMVELPELAERRADCLSGGQSQRVAIARALMQDPDVIFADEPVASLDPVAGDGIMALFQKLNRERGLTIVFVSHHLDHALTYAERILALKDGGLALDAETRSHTPQSLRYIYD